MFLGNVVDQLLDQDGLAHARTAEQTNLAALGIRAQQVDDLDAGFQNGTGCGLFIKGRRLAVNGHLFLGLHIPQSVNGLSQDIEHAPQNVFAHWRLDRLARIHGFHAPHQAVCAAHGNAADCVRTNALCHFHCQVRFSGAFDFNGCQEIGQMVLLEPDIHNRSHDL